MNIRWSFALILASLLLTACDESKPNKPPTPQVNAPSAPVLFGDQRKALDKAKGVEKTLENQSQEQRNAIDNAAQ